MPRLENLLANSYRRQLTSAIFLLEELPCEA